MHHLGAMLESGRGASKDLSQAKFWYEQAAALEYPPAHNDLGRLYLDGAGVPKNYAQARNLFEQASALGDAKAMNNLGLLYLDGKGVLRDIKTARAWFERAVVLKNVEAKANLDRLDQAGLSDGAQIAVRRAACARSCADLQRSYVGAVCGHYSSTGTEERPERTQCISNSLTLAKQCRDSCRDWASTLLPDNTCLSCFQSAIACGVSETFRSPGYEKAYSVSSKGCLGWHATCMTSCSREMISSSLAH